MQTFGWPVAIACLVVLGCATPQASRLSSKVDVTGTWIGSWSYGPGSAAGGTGALTFTFQQTGADVRGEVVNHSFPAFNGPIQGTLDGNTLQYMSPAGGGWLTVKGDRMYGRSRNGSDLMLERQR